MEKFYTFVGRVVRYGAAAILGAIIVLSQEEPREIELFSKEAREEMVAEVLLENLLLKAELLRIAEIANARGILDALMLEYGPLGAEPSPTDSKWRRAP